MTNTVEQLIEQLQRFNPLARVVPDLDIQGVSPATRCCVSVADDPDLNEEITSLEEKVEELDMANQAARADLVRVNQLCLQAAGTKKTLIEAIEKITTKHDK